MIARHTGLSHPRPAADTPQPLKYKRVGQYTIAVLPNGSASTSIQGKTQYFPTVHKAQEFLNLYQQGKHDRAQPIVYLGCSVVIYGSLAYRADDWAKAEARDRKIDEFRYVYYFQFNHDYGVDRVVTETYDDALFELKCLIEQESINSLPL